MVITTALLVLTLYVQLIVMLDYTGYWCRYQYHFTPMTWTSARYICESRNTTLLIIDSEDEMTNITSNIMSHVESIRPDAVTISSTMWIGLHQEVNPVRLLWDSCDEYTVDPNQWSGSAGTTAGCVLFNRTDSTYSIHPCSDTQPFICEDISEAPGDCYTGVPVENAPTEIQSDGSIDQSTSFEDCGRICNGDTYCAAFQAKDKDGVFFNCYRNYYDESMGLQVGRSPAKLFVKNLFVYSDQQPSNVPAMSEYYCPQPSTTIVPTSSSEYSTNAMDSSESSSVLYSSITIVTSSEDPILTSSNVVGGSTSSICYCPCTTALSSSSITSEELQAKIEKIQTELTVNKKETNSYKRKLTSAPDNRVSAQSIGYVGVLILTVVIGLLIFIDIPTLTKDTKRLFKRCCSACKK